MEHILLVVQVIIAAALIGMVLLQRSDTDGFGLGSGGSNLMSGRAKANLMTRTTAILAALFIINSLALSIMAAHHSPSSILETIDAQQATTDEAAPEKKPGVVVEKSIAPEKKPEVKAEKVEPTVKDSAPSVPNADETKPVKKVKAKVDAKANADKTSESESNE